MHFKFLIFLVLSFSLLSCNKKKASELSGVYDCSCSHKMIVPGSTNISIDYTTSVEFIQEKATLTIGEWTFPVRKLDGLDRFEEELSDGSVYSVDFDKDYVEYVKSVPTEQGVSETKCSGPKIP